MSIEARDFYRNGPSHRQGQASSFVLIRRQFDFRSIEIGRWVTNAERDRAAELFHDALCDLMLILQGPEALISLRGSLALQYGSGGRPGVSAHYDPSQRSFALAKNAGPGSIAHEWFHAFDHYIVTKCFSGTPNGMFASAAWLANAVMIYHPLNECLMRCFKAILLRPEGDQPSELFKHSVSMDKNSASSITVNPKSYAPAPSKPLYKTQQSPTTSWSKALKPLLRPSKAFTHRERSEKGSMPLSANILEGWGRR